MKRRKFISMLAAIPAAFMAIFKTEKQFNWYKDEIVPIQGDAFINPPMRVNYPSPDAKRKFIELSKQIEIERTLDNFDPFDHPITRAAMSYRRNV